MFSKYADDGAIFSILIMVHNKIIENYDATHRMYVVPGRRRVGLRKGKVGEETE